MAQDVARLGPQGRLVIPAGMRRALNLSEGDTLVIRQDGDRLVMERREAVLHRLYGRWRTPAEQGTGAERGASSAAGGAPASPIAPEGVA